MAMLTKAKRRQKIPIRRRTLFALALASGLATRASAQDRRIPRIGMMFTSPVGPPTQQYFDALVAGLTENGFVPERDVVLDIRVHRGDPERMARVVAELVASGVDVIYAPSTSDALAAKKATSTIPIVFAGPGDPVGSGLVASLAHPGGNVTGVSSQGVDLAPKQLQYLMQAIPDARRIVVLFQPGNPPHEAGMAQLRQMGAALKIEITPVAAQEPADITPAFQRIAVLKSDALIIFDSPFAYANRAQIVGLAMSHRLPTMCQSPVYLQHNALMSFGPRLTEIVHLAASFLARILRGANPRDLPVEQPTRFELVVNLRAAKTLGLSLPVSFLAGADEVME
jgi:putative ABC transport system substrate-binding protein